MNSGGSDRRPLRSGTAATATPSAMVNKAEASSVYRPPMAITTGPPISVPSAVEGVVSAVRVASTR
jgi:hypothetical protein